MTCSDSVRVLVVLALHEQSLAGKQRQVVLLEQLESIALEHALEPRELVDLLDELGEHRWAEVWAEWAIEYW